MTGGITGPLDRGSQEHTLITKALPKLTEIDELVSAFQSYLRAEDNVFLQGKVPQVAKMNFLNEQRQDFVNRVTVVLEELQMFANTDIYKRVEKTVNDAKQSAEDQEKLEITYQDLRDVSETLHQFKENSKVLDQISGEVNHLKAEEDFHFQTCELIQSLTSGFLVFVRNGDLSMRGKVVTLNFLTTWINKFEDFIDESEARKVSRHSVSIVQNELLAPLNELYLKLQNIPFDKTAMDEILLAAAEFHDLLKHEEFAQVTAEQALDKSKTNLDHMLHGIELILNREIETQ